MAAALLSVIGAGAAGALAARTFGRLEDAGSPVSGPIVFALVAALLALGETAAVGGAGARFLLPAALLLVGVAVLATVAARWSARRGAVPWPWGRTLALLLAGRGARPGRCQGPCHGFSSRGGPPARIGPPSVLLVDLGALEGDQGRGQLARSLARAGRRRARRGRRPLRRPPRIRRAEPCGRDPGPAGRAARPARGRRTGVRHGRIRPRRRARRGAAAPHLDATPGPGGLLAAVAARTAAGPLVLALPARSRAALGLARDERTPAQLTGDVLDWLRWWRATRSVSPVFLVVDYGTVASAGPEPLDPALRRLSTASSSSSSRRAP